LGINEIWQADLVDMQALAKQNRGYKYILTVIDTFSKIGHAVPLKTKTAKEVAAALEMLLSTNKGPKVQNLHTDQGTEFFNSDARKVMSDFGVNHYNTYSDKKAMIVERFNRTLKQKMWRKFTEFNTHNWLDMLDKLIDEYNKSYHRSIKMRPVDVSKQNEKQVHKNLYPGGGSRGGESKRPKFGVGDKVRISKHKGIFEKGYTFNWSEEVFNVTEVMPTNPTVYKIADQLKTALKGTFYDHELQKTQVPEYGRIERVLRRKGNKLRVKWKGYDNRFNSWVDASETVRL
jgi:hypothetical protein